MHTRLPNTALEQDPRAFTLVELLVSISIVAILVSVLLPALASVRGRSQAVKSLSNLRSIGVTTSVYAAEHDTYPYGRFGFGRPPGTGAPAMLGFEPWALDRLWPVLFHTVAPWVEHHESWISPGADDRDRFSRLWDDPNLQMTNAIAPSYRYSNSFVGDPAVWEPGADAQKQTARAVTPAQVQWPSQKAMFYDAEPPGFDADSPARGVLGADGAASQRHDEDGGDVTQNPLWSVSPRIYHDTLSGVRGQDL